MLFDTYKGLTHRVKPLSLKQCRYPINNPIHNACHRTEDDDGARDGENFGAESQDDALCCCQYRTHHLKNIYIKSAVWYNEIK